MHLTLRQLQCFRAVAQNLSFTRAAEQLHLTQPAVSMQVRQLEQQTGIAFTYDDKMRIAEGLAEAGIHRIEAGLPAYWRKHGFPPQCRPVGADDFKCSD